MSSPIPAPMPTSSSTPAVTVPSLALPPSKRFRTAVFEWPSHVSKPSLPSPHSLLSPSPFDMPVASCSTRPSCSSTAKPPKTTTATAKAFAAAAAAAAMVITTQPRSNLSKSISFANVHNNATYTTDGDLHAPQEVPGTVKKMNVTSEQNLVEDCTEDVDLEALTYYPAENVHDVPSDSDEEWQPERPQVSRRRAGVKRRAWGQVYTDELE